MKINKRGNSTGFRLLLTLACLVIVFSGLKAAAPIFIPLVIAFFLSLLSAPVTLWLRKHKLPNILAVLLTIVLNIIIVGLVVLLGINLISDFQEVAKDYIIKIRYLAEATVGLLEERGFKNAKEFFLGYLKWDEIIKFVTNSQIIGTLIDFLKTLFIIIIVMCFTLTEAIFFSDKLKTISKTRAPDLSHLKKTSVDIQRYLGIKTLISALTGLLAGLVVWLFGEDFVLLWALLAFAFNFIPAIGSIMAAIPPVLVALVNGLQTTATNEIAISSLKEIDFTNALGILIGYLIINVAIGNFLDPMLLGRRFGLSTLWVMLSVFFWGWLWGGVGMFLAVPLTMLVKVSIDNTSDLKWLSIIMEKHKPKELG